MAERGSAPEPPRGVLFDFFDTLAWIEPSVVEGGRRELAWRAGLTPEELAARWRQQREARVLGQAGDLETQLRTMLEAAGRTASAETIAALADLERRTWERAVHLYPDTLPALRELRRRGFKLAILSNCTCQAGAVVYQLGMAELVDAVLLSYEVGLAKPDPAFYQRACAALGVPPAACAFVADGAGGELEAASALGLRTIRIHRPHPRHPDDGQAVRADAHVRTLAEALALLPARREATA